MGLMRRRVMIQIMRVWMLISNHYKNSQTCHTAMMDLENDEPLILPLTDEESRLRTQIDPLPIDRENEPMIKIPISKPKTDRSEVLKKARQAKEMKAKEKEIMDNQLLKEVAKLREENNYFKSLATKLASQERRPSESVSQRPDPFEKYSFTKKNSLV